eukprot:12365164-Alexandrium_andersonii.AAC.1
MGPRTETQKHHRTVSEYRERPCQRSRLICNNWPGYPQVRTAALLNNPLAASESATIANLDEAAVLASRK